MWRDWEEWFRLCRFVPPFQRGDEIISDTPQQRRNETLERTSHSNLEYMELLKTHKKLKKRVWILLPTELCVLTFVRT